jgi:hypothetical protein
MQGLLDRSPFPHRPIGWMRFGFGRAAVSGEDNGGLVGALRHYLLASQPAPRPHSAVYESSHQAVLASNRRGDIERQPASSHHSRLPGSTQAIFLCTIG